MKSLLFEVSPADPITYLAVSATLIAAAILASYLPARRATTIDPSEALQIRVGTRPPACPRRAKLAGFLFALASWGGPQGGPRADPGQARTATCCQWRFDLRLRRSREHHPHRPPLTDHRGNHPHPALTLLPPAIPRQSPAPSPHIERCKPATPSRYRDHANAPRCPWPSTPWKFLNSIA